MKVLLITLLLLISSRVIAQDEPMVLIGKRYANVQRVFEHFKYTHNLISKTDTSLTYYGWKSLKTYTYTFYWYKYARYCTSCSVTMDCIEGEEHIGSHKDDWKPISDVEWKYHTPAYSIPIDVKLLYDNDHMVFIYSYTLN